MKLALRQIVFGWFILGCALTCIAKNDTIFHDFDVMAYAGTLTFGSPVNYAVGNTDEVTYTCSGTVSTKFDKEYKYNAKYAINMPSSLSKVITSPAVNNLWKFEIWHYSAVSKATNIEVYVSTDAGDTWKKATGDSIDYSYNVISVTLPMNNYCFKIKNTSSSNFSILTTKFISTPPAPCNCLKVAL